MLCLVFTGPLTAQVIRGPYLQQLNSNSVIVKWRTDFFTESILWYGPAPGSLVSSVHASDTYLDHELKVEGLSPSTRYYYAIGDSSGFLAGDNADYFFETAPMQAEREQFKAWIMGDVGTANADARAVRDAYYSRSAGTHTDLLLLLGDNAYLEGTDADYQDAIFENMLEDLLVQTAIWSCPGNHDLRSYPGLGLTAPYFDIFVKPTAAECGGFPSGTEHYYSFDFANVHFVCLDSEKSGRNPTDPMLLWLNNDLALNEQDWTVLLFHHPAYSKASHDSDFELQLIEMRSNVVPILENYGVDLVLAGHSHAYERSFLLNGHYATTPTFDSSLMLVDGGDGRVDGDGMYEKKLAGPNKGKGTVYLNMGSSGQVASIGTLDHPAHYYGDFSLGSVELTVAGLQMDVVFLDENGTVDDYFSMSKMDLSALPTINLTAPPALLPGPKPINLMASASDPDGSVAYVEFRLNGILYAVDYSAPYTVSWTPANAGFFLLDAKVVDDDGLYTESDSFLIRVGKELTNDLHTRID